MKKIQIAILDSGISVGYKELDKVISKKVDLINNNSTDLTIDTFGHGTACASTIIKECSDIEIHSYKILDNFGQGKVSLLEEALELLLEEDIDLINLSISILGNDNLKGIKNILKQLRKSGKIITCALSNSNRLSYPAQLKSCLGVRGFILKNPDDFWFQRFFPIECIVDNEPHFHCDGKGEYCLFGKSNSYATAKFTGKIASIMSKQNIFTEKELFDELKKNSSRNFWTNLSLRKSKRFPNFEYINTDKYILKEITALTKRHFNCYLSDKELSEYSLFSTQIGITYENSGLFLNKIISYFNLKSLRYSDISRENVYSIHHVADLIKKYL